MDLITKMLITWIAITLLIIIIFVLVLAIKDTSDPLFDKTLKAFGYICKLNALIAGISISVFLVSMWVM